jgi:asparagine synthetase B (glutamine-hydrolysing)
MKNGKSNYNRQFALVKEICRTPDIFNHWIKKKIGDFTLFSHPNLSLTEYKSELTLLGFMIDYKCPEKNNSDILADISSARSHDGLLNKTFDYFGQFVLICNNQEGIHLFQDAGGQKEVYYNLNYSCIASQPKLMKHFCKLEEDLSQDAISFYNSKNFANKKVFLGEKTNYKNIKRLPPNHLLELINKKTIRFFPDQHLEIRDTTLIAKEIATRLMGCGLALKNRFNPVFLVSGGWDSRVMLALCSKVDIECKVFRKPTLENNHYDVTIPSDILNGMGKKLSVVDYELKPDVKEEYVNYLIESVDFPRTDSLTLSYIFKGLIKNKDKLVVTGHMGEIGRN